jgi:hypothetical protein
MSLGPSIPALPMSDTAATTVFYRDRLKFTVEHSEESFLIVRRDACVLHLWLADDNRWRERADFVSAPIRSGAEDFLAGTASCRIEVSDGAELDALFAEMAEVDVLHRVSRSGVATTDYGMRELHVSDPDNNLLTFFCRV